jgi:hypothetical protein
LGFDHLLGLLGVSLFLGQVGYRHIGALAGVDQRDGAPDARIASGDQGGSTLELTVGLVARRKIARTGLEFCLYPRFGLMLLWKRRLGFGLHWCHIVFSKKSRPAHGRQKYR